MKDYTVINYTNIDSFRCRVNDMLSDGWELFGETFTYPNDQPKMLGDGTFFCQAFTRNSQENKESTETTHNNAMFQLLFDLKEHCEIYGSLEFVKFNRKELLKRINAVLAQQKHS